MTHTDLTTVFTTNQVAEAEILKSMLESEGISCLLDGAHQASFTGVLDIRGQTRTEDEDRARKILGRHAHRRDDLPSRAPEHAGPSHPRLGLAHAHKSRHYSRESSGRSLPQ